MRPIHLILFALGFALPLSLKAQDEIHEIPGITIEKVLIAEEIIDTGHEQLVEVTIRNATPNAHHLQVRLVITLPNRNIITFGNKEIVAGVNSDTTALIPYPIGKHDGGDFTVAVRVFDKKEVQILQTSKLQELIFYGLDRSIRNAPPAKRRGKKLSEEEEAQVAEKKKEEEKLATKVNFDPPDLKYERVTLLASSVLRGESTHVRLYIYNDGGNTANNVEYTLYWYFAQRPNRKVLFFRDRLGMIAPGEHKVLEVPLTIPGVEQKGKYQVLAKLDEDKTVAEINENNNEETTDQPLIFGDVALVFPADSYSFAEDGLFQFEWRSQKYNQFKLQISADSEFANEADSFYLPMGDHWTPSLKINPMKGEMPTMATALMESAETDHLYWRVVAKNSAGEITESQARKFLINLKPKE